MYKIKITNNELDKLKREQPQARFVHLGDVFFGVENIPESAILKYQVALKSEQSETSKQQDTEPAKQNEATKQVDIATVMQTLIKSTAQPLLDGTIDELKKQIDEKVQKDITDLSNQIEDLANKINVFTIDTTRKMDEFANLIQQQKQLQLEEVKQVLSKLANLNKYLRDIPQI